jgi:hypothetical protein
MAAAVGTAIHVSLEPPGEKTRYLRGTVNGVPVIGVADVILPGAIEDYKTSKSPPPGGTIRPDERVQTSIYGMLVEQAAPSDLWTEGEPFSCERVSIWYLKLPERRWLPRRDAKPMTEREVLAFRPHGGRKNLRELLATHAAALANPGSIPEEMDGRSMRMGRGTICDYCDVLEPCTRLEEATRGR